MQVEHWYRRIRWEPRLGTGLRQCRGRPRRPADGGRALGEGTGVTRAGGAQALGVSPVTVKRWVQAYREHGTEGLDRMRAPRQHRVLDSERHRTADLLHVGRSLRSVALALDVNREAQHQ